MPMTRRGWLAGSGGGFGSLALAALLAGERDADAATGLPDVHPACVYPPKVKRVVQLFMAGAASHLDLYDYKPELVRQHGKPSDFGEPVEAFQSGLGPWLEPIWDFKPYGHCGKLLSDVAAPLHQTTGFVLPGFPGAGCWVNYALGSLNDNLPTFVVLPDHRGYASNGVKNWDAGFLPAQYSGTVVQPADEEPVADLRPHRSASFVTPTSDAAAHDVIAALNRRHRDARGGDGRLEARIRSYELAARMQLAAPEALALADEPEHILELYGVQPGRTSWPSRINAEEETHHFGLRCLAARRLLERGVRLVQVWSGNDNGFPRRNWDSHEDVERDHGPLALGMSRGAAALVKDLDRRGLLDDTLVLWTTEFGRMPSSQRGKGRDHNPFVFTNWLCGGGIRGGVTHGESDQWGYKPLDRDHPTTVHDVHATVLRLLGIEHTKLTWRNNGIDRRLTDVHGHVIDGILG